MVIRCLFAIRDQATKCDERKEKMEEKWVFVNTNYEDAWLGEFCRFCWSCHEEILEMEIGKSCMELRWSDHAAFFL